MAALKEILLGLALAALGTLLGGSLYESVVNAPNMRAGIPDSLEHFRRFMSVTNPGTFFRVVAPLAQLLTLASLVLCWRRPAGRRWWLLAALACVAVADVITFTFHYPRNALLFGDPLRVAPQELERAAAEWAYGNYLRIALVGAALACVVRALSVGRRVDV